MAYENSIHSREVVRTPQGFPVKMYTFSIAFDVFEDMSEIKMYLTGMLRNHPEISDGHTFAIAAPWGYRDESVPVKAVDVLSYRFDKPWNECNPDVDAWVFKNGVYVPEDVGLTCETTLIILGEEGKLRRRTSGLEEYLKVWPELGDLGPVVRETTFLSSR